MDSIDHRILELLAWNARISNRDIAKVVGRSDRTVARRIKKMEMQGIIQQYTLKWDPNILGATTVTAQLQANMSILEWENIRALLTRLFGSGAGFILFQIGYTISQSWGARIQATGLMPRSQLLAFTQLLEEEGWGRLDIRHLDFKTKSGTLVLVTSPFMKQRRHNRCDELIGLITGFLETLFTTPIIVTEVKCTVHRHIQREYKFKEDPLERFPNSHLIWPQISRMKMVERGEYSS